MKGGDLVSFLLELSSKSGNLLVVGKGEGGRGEKWEGGRGGEGRVEGGEEGRGKGGGEGRGGKGEGHIILNLKLEMITNIYIPCLFLKTNGLLSLQRTQKKPST